MSKNLFTVARIIYSIPLFIVGFIYLFKPQESVETLTSFIPGGLSLIYVAGGLWVVIGLLIALNIKTKWAAYSAIVLLLLYQIMVHIPALYTGDYLAVVWFELLRDISLMGGAVFLVAGARTDDEPEFVESDDWHTSSN